MDEMALFASGVEMTDQEFNRIRDLVKVECGISLGPDKKSLLRSRLQKRLRALGLKSYMAYYRYVTENPEGHAELVHFLDAISTNKTDFFREPNHFTYLRTKVLPSLLEQKKRQGNRRLRIWCAAASTGEEPYTLAMVLTEALGNLMATWDCRILASDISTRVLRAANQGVYEVSRLAPVPPDLKHRYFRRVAGATGVHMQVTQNLRSMIAFNRINLLDESYPFRGPFDFIFCRNVMIYFDPPTRQALVNRFYRFLSPGGLLFVGHSESLSGLKTHFQTEAPAVYRRREG